jgi:hypothetical protein
MRASNVQTIKQLVAATKAILDLASDIADRTSSCELSIEVSNEANKPVCRVTLQLEIEQLGELQ